MFVWPRHEKLDTHDYSDDWRLHGEFGAIAEINFEKYLKRRIEFIKTMKAGFGHDTN